MANIGFIGAGNMAEAIIKGLISASTFRRRQIFISDTHEDRLKYMKDTTSIMTCDTNGDLCEKVDILILSVKPQMMDIVFEQISGKIKPETLIISIAAGLPVMRFTDALGDFPVIRVMPNTPALVGCGASALYANAAAESRMEEALEIFRSVGVAFAVETEEMIDTVTALSGSGPAYYFLLMEEMIKAAQQIGLDYNTARQLTLQTALGAAKLAVHSDKQGLTPGQLRQNVTSPGGTTEAAIKVFEEDQFDAIVLLAMQRAKERSEELSN